MIKAAFDFGRIGGSALRAAAIGAVAGAVVWGIRYWLWPNTVPRLIARLRWLIALAIGILLIAIEIPLGLDVSGSAVNAGVVWLIAEGLKNDARAEGKG